MGEVPFSSRVYVSCTRDEWSGGPTLGRRGYIVGISKSATWVPLSAVSLYFVVRGGGGKLNYPTPRCPASIILKVTPPLPPVRACLDTHLQAGEYLLSLVARTGVKIQGNVGSESQAQKRDSLLHVSRVPLHQPPNVGEELGVVHHAVRRVPLHQFEKSIIIFRKPTVDKKAG